LLRLGVSAFPPARTWNSGSISGETGLCQAKDQRKIELFGNLSF